jgi:hypothetical protein
MYMNHRYLYLWIVLLATIVVGCQNDVIGEFEADDSTLGDGSSVITLYTGKTDGVINLSVDAPLSARANVWIDLDGNGTRAEDGSENVKTFNEYREYSLAGGVKRLSIHGDITYLDGASNELTEIDISNNPFLRVLNVPLNQLSSIDVSKNPSLERLDCSANRIGKLDLSSNPALVSLWVFNNELSSLNLSNNGNLELLDCSGNKLSSLDLSANSQLKQLLCYNNALSALDVSNKEQLNRLWLFGNPVCGDAGEVENLLYDLNETINGDLWIGEANVNESMQTRSVTKGWIMQ